MPPEASSSTPWRDGVAPRHGFGQLGWSHIVQQDDIRPDGKHRVELVERVHLDFDNHRRVTALLFDITP